ncbi:hypothetical protein GOBAR_DD34898 [Gossypium barbadense]|nr:hypothetical protein GOBAR_DD34898 [Gossypium barbadense]
MDGPIVSFIVANVEATGARGSDAATSDKATTCEGSSRTNVLDRPSTKFRVQVDTTGGSSKSLSNHAISMTTNALSFNSFPNFANSLNMNNSCLNPVFVGQEDNDGDALGIKYKADLMVPELVEIKVTDPIGGLYPQKHTTVSFNKNESAGGNFSRKKNTTDFRVISHVF